MSCGSLSKSTSRVLNGRVGIYQYEWYTDWVLATGVGAFVATLQNRGTSGPLRTQVVMQVAAVRTDNPGSVTAYGSAIQGDNASVVSSGDISSTTGSVFYVRFGVKYDSNDADDPASGEVELQVSYVTCGQVVGAFNQQLTVVTDAQKQFVAVTAWLPALLAAKIKTAAIVTGLYGDFTWRMTYRTAAVTPASADAWEQDWDSTHNPAKNTEQEVCVPELSPSTSGKMWVQIGIIYYLPTSGDPGSASIQATVTARK